VFLYGKLNIGKVTRTLFARPVIGGAAVAGNALSIPVNFRTKLLLDFDTAQLLRDCLSSHTYVMEVHDEDISRRAFNIRNTEAYNVMVKSASEAPAMSPRSAAKTSLVAASAAGSMKPGAKGAPPVDTGPPTRTITPSTSPINDVDRFLMKCIADALASASQIRAHGTIRFRLEKLLESNVDIIKRFERLKKEGRTSGNEGVTLEVSFCLAIMSQLPSSI
jgi:hypothetical protein